MTSIETYQERIAAVKASIETLKDGNKPTITRLDGTEYRVETQYDLNFRWGAVIIDSEGEVYLRTRGAENEYWSAAKNAPKYRNCREMFNHMRDRASEGVTYRFLHETGSR